MRNSVLIFQKLVNILYYHCVAYHRCFLPYIKPWFRSVVTYQMAKLMIGVIVSKQFQKFEKVKSVTPFSHPFLLFYADTPFKQCLNCVTIRQRG